MLELLQDGMTGVDYNIPEVTYEAEQEVKAHQCTAYGNPNLPTEENVAYGNASLMT